MTIMNSKDGNETHYLVLKKEGLQRQDINKTAGKNGKYALGPGRV